MLFVLNNAREIMTMFLFSTIRTTDRFVIHALSLEEPEHVEVPQHLQERPRSGSDTTSKHEALSSMARAKYNLNSPR